jgi:hypothetical protein
MNRMLGKTICKISHNSEVIEFIAVGGEVFKFFHYQCCCESVLVEDITGDLQDLLGSPLLMAEETCNQKDGEYGMSQTWTFYKFATQKGYVTIRWYGTSNGYYSERVSLEESKLDFSGENWPCGSGMTEDLQVLVCESSLLSQVRALLHSGLDEEEVEYLLKGATCPVVYDYCEQFKGSRDAPRSTGG